MKLDVELPGGLAPVERRVFRFLPPLLVDCCSAWRWDCRTILRTLRCKNKISASDNRLVAFAIRSCNVAWTSAGSNKISLCANQSSCQCGSWMPTSTGEIAFADGKLAVCAVCCVPFGAEKGPAPFEYCILSSLS